VTADDSLFRFLQDVLAHPRLCDRNHLRFNMPHETLNWKIHDDHDQVQRCVCPPPKDTSASGPPWDAKVDTGSTLAACEQGIAGRPTGLVAERQKPIMSNLNPTSRHLLMKIIKTPARQTIVHLQPESGTFPQAQHHRHEHVYLKEHNIMIEPVTAEAAPPSIFQIRLKQTPSHITAACAEGSSNRT